MSDWAFLNRMAITAGVVAAVLIVLTLLRPLKQPVTLPEQQQFDMTASGGAKLCGVLVVLATLALYIIFW